MSKEEIKIKDILKEKVKNIKEDASLFMYIAKDFLTKEINQIPTDDGYLNLFDFVDSFIITLTVLETVGMEEELFNDLMLKMYSFMREYFFGDEEEEKVEDEKAIAEAIVEIAPKEEITDESIDKET